MLKTIMSLFAKKKAANASNTIPTPNHTIFVNVTYFCRTDEWSAECYPLGVYVKGDYRDQVVLSANESLAIEIEKKGIMRDKETMLIKYIDIEYDYPDDL